MSRSRVADIRASKVHAVAYRPGQVVALDTTPLPVKVREGVFGDPVSAHPVIQHLTAVTGIAGSDNYR